MKDDFVFGRVALIGRPNVGKSTLLNAILDEPLSIATPKPQTTRHRIVGIYNGKHSQVVFVDTPGYHRSDKTFNQAMLEVVNQVIDEVDLIGLIVDPRERDLHLERELFDRIGPQKCLVILNKCDLADRSRYETMARRVHDEWGATEVIALSALHRHGIELLVERLEARLPKGEAHYPKDEYTSHPVRFLVAELIREQVFLQLKQEIPYSTAVVIESFQEATESNPITRISAAVIVEREAHKKIVIGEGGARIKQIGQLARKKIEELVGGKVFLELFVKVEKDWTKDRQKIHEFGYI